MSIGVMVSKHDEIDNCMAWRLIADAASAGGFPAMVGNVAFLMKDVALLAVSFYLLKQDVDITRLITEATR
jgi:hypothetical protein